MRNESRHPPVRMAVLTAAAAWVAVACGGALSQTDAADLPAAGTVEGGSVAAEVTAPPASPTPTAAMTPDDAGSRDAGENTSSPAVETTGTAVTSDPGYDPETNMYELFGGRDHPSGKTLNALAKALKNNDRSQVPVIVQLMRFGIFLDFPIDATETMANLTGRSAATDPASWSDWMVWLGENSSEFAPPVGYAAWKANLLSLLHPRFQQLLATAATTSRIDLTEVAWGGVGPDGIPDLQFPPVLAADQQDYLSDGARVFGVSINGEHRAYPISIMNPHEMANDILGGEPIALAY